MISAPALTSFMTVRKLFSSFVSKFPSLQSGITVSHKVVELDAELILTILTVKMVIKSK